MNIGIIGSGNVGGALGTRWAQGGHQVVFGSRNPNGDQIQEVVKTAGPKARAATLQDAAGNDVLLLSTPWPATRQALEGLGSLAGKVLLDATNPLAPNLAGLEYGTTTSNGEMVASWATGAKVVKIFNTVGFNIMANPIFGSDRAVMFYCGDDAGAKRVAKQLAEELNFDAADAGPLAQARLLEPFAVLWISLALVHGFGREIGFKLMRR